MIMDLLTKDQWVQWQTTAVLLAILSMERVSGFARVVGIGLIQLQLVKVRRNTKYYYFTRCCQNLQLLNVSPCLRLPMELA